MGNAWSQMAADRAFARVSRARRRASLRCRLRRLSERCGRLPVYDLGMSRRSGVRAGRRLREIPLDAIDATVEPNMAAQFDRGFRPAARARERWQRIWLAEHRGGVLPPISVVRIGDAYAIRDGHHRVSVARARGALTIAALVS
jgi:hypothetical protein